MGKRCGKNGLAGLATRGLTAPELRGLDMVTATTAAPPRPQTAPQTRTAPGQGGGSGGGGGGPRPPRTDRDMPDRSEHDWRYLLPPERQQVLGKTDPKDGAVRVCDGAEGDGCGRLEHYDVGTAKVAGDGGRWLRLN